MKITLISPYHGGSHKAWADGFAAASSHGVLLLTLPDRFWKWRMHGGAVTLARRFLQQQQSPDLLLVTDMLDLTTFLALTRPSTHNIPVALYMHENQLTYPLPTNGRTGPMRRQHGERDLHYVFINFASMLAADHIFFNSDYHRRSLFEALPRYLRRFPEYNELGMVDQLANKSSVLPVGLNLERLNHAAPAHPACNQPPLILWNQRWEYDKNPDAFFQALFAIQQQGIPFQLALCGQQYGKRPSIFTTASKRLSSHIVHEGHASRAEYHNLLWQADITVSTAVHEFFGISVLEAIHCHTRPLLPRRLTYPKLLPTPFHANCLYNNHNQLVDMLSHALTHPQENAAIATALAPSTGRFGWQTVAPRYDTALAQMAAA